MKPVSSKFFANAVNVKNEAEFTLAARHELTCVCPCRLVIKTACAILNI